MLKFNMASLSEKELGEAVARSCAGYGAIKKLRIYPANGTLARPFALVDMETPEQAESLAAAFGLRTMGNAVVIILQHEAVDVCTPLPARSARPAADDTLALILEELRHQS